ncbi:DNA alkylation repair protein [Gilliamella sp. ESL0443]|uniref:DNA alkylation repair protein n=1 Tax=Gilliamella sp. ESL0443 TaxID=2704655 RepID=UPI001C6A6FFB|nr:DNA alkylation repair protein [Gilliamella sp. ESL0443]QYN42502.1 DNA alkylation repair protein [Gilliamella sp. ESL0443]
MKRYQALNQGLIQSKVLNECLKVDQKQLFSVVINQYFSNTNKNTDALLEQINNNSKPSITYMMKLISTTLIEHLSEQELKKILTYFNHHVSDTVRGWGCFVIGNSKYQISFEERLRLIMPFAKDEHFGVREWAWLALREQLEANLIQSITILEKWAKSSNPYVRRFAIESIRPRGVWSSHIKALKEKPELALAILEILHNDPEKYVQDSISNWLNDASKSQPDWVITLCNKWTHQNPSLYTRRIIKRALRSIKPTKISKGNSK